MDVTIISCFGYYEQRVRFIKDAFESKGYNVTIVFSDFDHINKTKVSKQLDNVVYLSARPYKKNLSISRIYSHFLFSKTVYHHICKQRPDLIYAIIPPNSLGKFLGHYKKKNKVRLIYDIYDLWPESMVNRWLSKLAAPFFIGWRNLRNKSLDSADFVVTECELYQEHLKDYLQGKRTKTIYLTKEREFLPSAKVEPLDTLRICYLGSINNIINISLIKHFLTELKTYRSLVVEVVGKGETKSLFMKELSSIGIEVIDHGALYGEGKIRVLERCHFGINMMVNTVRVGLTMKSVDYFEANLPLINNISGDTWDIIKKEKVGFNISEDNIADVSKQIANLSQSEYMDIKNNVNRVFEEKFSLAAFNHSFQTVLDVIDNFMKKEILILCNHEIVLFNFKKELVQKIRESGYNVHISMPFDRSIDFFKNQLQCDCIETLIDRRGVNPVIDFRLVRFYRKLIKKLNPDLIFSLTIKPTIYGGLLSRSLSVPYITNITGLGSAFQEDNWLRKFVVLMYKLSLKKVQGCFFENEGNRNVFLEDKIISKQQSIVVNGAGVNLNEFAYHKLENKTKQVFGFIGRVMREKGIDEFLYCVEQMKNENVEFRVYGFCEEEYKDRLNYFEQFDNFHYYGFCNNIKELYLELDCIVLPSYHEGMSNVLLEGAATGRILITTNIHGCKEALIDHKTGFLVEKASEESLLRACREALALSYTKRVEYGIEARKLMEERFDRSKINDAYMNKIQSILAVGRDTYEYNS